MEVKANDWIATLMYNPDKSVEDLARLGIVPDNTGMKSKEDYKKLTEVQKAFVDDKGNFDEKTFDDFYDTALVSYNEYAKMDHLDALVGQYTYDKGAWFAPLGAARKDTSPYIEFGDSYDVSVGVPYIKEIGKPSTAGLSAREIGQTQKVVDYATGEELDYTPNDLGFFKYFTQDTLVLAQYEEDGFHDEDGVQVKHQKGEYKLKNGKTYYETLSGRESYGRILLNPTDIITTDGSKWNKIDFLDSDGIDKSVGAVAVETAVKLAPMFIPYVGLAYGAITLSANLARFIPTVTKAVNGAITGNNNGAFGQFLTQWENYAEGHLNWNSMSDNASSKLVSTEGVGNMMSMITGQLFQQKIVGAIPSLISKSKAVKANVELGKKLALAYMAGTSAQEVYGDFKQAGASDRWAGIGMIASILALNRLMNIDYFRDTVFLKGTIFDESALRTCTRNASGEIRKATQAAMAKASATTEKEAAAGLITKLEGIYYEKFLTGLTSSEVFNKAFAEGVEEGMEEVTTDIIKAFTKGCQMLGFNVADPDAEEVDFGMTLENVGQRYLTTVLGGAIGGAVFHYQGKYDKWYNKTFKGAAVDDLEGVADADTKRLVYYVAQGKADEIRQYFTKWWQQGLFGSKNLSNNSVTVSYIDGDKKVKLVAQENEATQNDIGYAHAMNYIAEVEQIINAETGSVWLKDFDQELIKIIARGFSDEDVSETIKDTKLHKAHMLVEMGASSAFLNDFYDCLSDIVTVKQNINDEIKKISSSSDVKYKNQESEERIQNDPTIQRLKISLENLQQKKEAFLRGDRNKYYIGQGLVFCNPHLNKLLLDMSNVEDYVKLKHNINYTSLSEEKKKEYDAEYQDFITSEGSEKIKKAYDIYLAYSNAVAEKLTSISQELSQLKADIAHTTDYEFEKYLEAEDQFEQLKAQYDTIALNPNKTDAEIAKLQELEAKLIPIQETMALYQLNPEFLTQLSMNESFEDLRKLMVASKLPGFGPEGLTALAARVEQYYQSSIDSHAIVQSDEALDTLLAAVKSSMKSVEIPRRIENALTRFKAKYLPGVSDLDIEEMPEITDAFNIESDPLIWSSQSYPIHRDLALAVEKFFDSIGSSNDEMIKNLQNIKTLLKTRSKLNDEQIEFFMQDFMPMIGDETLETYILRIDGLRQQVNYSPVNDLFKHIAFTIGESEQSILDLIANEEKALAGVSKISDYIIGNKSVEALFELKSRIGPILQILAATIQGSYDGTNATINAAKGGDVGPLAVIDENSAKLLMTELTKLLKKIDFIKALSDSNNQSSLKIQRNIEINMRGKFIKELVDLQFAKEFDKVFVPHYEDRDKPMLVELWEQCIEGIGFDWNSITEENYNELNAVFIKFETMLGELLRNSPAAKTKQDFAKALVSIIPERSELYKQVSSNLSEDPNEKVTPYDLLEYLTELKVLPANVFYSKEQELLVNAAQALSENSGQVKFVAPVFGQEWGVKAAIATILDVEQFNCVIDEFSKVEGINLPPFKDDVTKNRFKKYIEARPKLHNFLAILGGAGTGKTVGFARNFVQMLQSSSDSYQIATLAPSTFQAKNIAANLGLTDDNLILDRKSFSERVFGKVLGNYRRQTVTENNETTPTGMLETSDTVTEYKDGIFDKSKKIKVLIMDEITLFTKDELAYISDWASQQGVVVIGLGDTKQNAIRVNIAEAGKTAEYGYTGIEDCFFRKVPSLTASFRAENEAQRVNYIYLNTLLTKINNDYSQNPQWSIEVLNKQVPESIPLRYYESPDKSVLYGTKLVSTPKELTDSIDSFIGKGTIGIITDDVDKYSQYIGRDKEGIKVVDARVAQGGEFDYIFVDTNFAGPNKIGGSVSKYSVLRDLYTLTQRARKGGVILQNDLRTHLNITDNVSDPLLNQVHASASAEQIGDFIQWKMGTLQGLMGNDNLAALMSGVDLKSEESSEVVVTDSTSASGTTDEETASGETTNSGTTPASDTNPTGAQPTTPEQSEVSESTSQTSSQSNTEQPAVADKPAPNPDPSKNGETVVPDKIDIPKATKPTHRLISCGDFNKFILQREFLEQEEAEETSLYSFIKENGGNITSNELLYRRIVHAISSYIFNVKRADVAVNGINGDAILKIIEDDCMKLFSNIPNPRQKSVIRAKLHELLKSEPEIYVVPGGEAAALIAEFKTTTDELIRIPIGFISSRKFGKYNGTFSLKQKISIVENKEGSTKLSDLISQHPFLRISPEYGLLTITQDLEQAIQQSSDLSDSTKDFLLSGGTKQARKGRTRQNRNNGKVFAGIVGQSALAGALSRRMWTPSKANKTAITGYDKVGLIEIHKLIDPMDILQFAYEYGIKTKTSNLTLAEILSADGTRTPNIFDIDSKRAASLMKEIQGISAVGPKFWQEVARRKYQLVQNQSRSLGCLTYCIIDSKNPEVFMNYQYFVGHINSARTISGGMVVSNQGKSYLIEAVRSERGLPASYIATPYNSASGTIAQGSIISLGSTLPSMDELSATLFSDKNPINTLAYLARIVTEEDDETKKDIRYLTPNESVAVLMAGIKPEKFNDIAAKIKQHPQYAHGVYTNLTGEKALGTYFKEYEGDHVADFVTKVKDIKYEVYTMDINQLESSTTTPTPDESAPDNSAVNPSQVTSETQVPGEQPLPPNTYRKLEDICTQWGIDVTKVMDLSVDYLNNFASFVATDWDHVKTVVQNQDGTYTVEVKSDYEHWMQAHAMGTLNEIITTKEDALTCKFIIFSVTLDNGSIEYRILHKVNNEWKEVNKFNSYPAYKNVLNLIEQNPYAKELINYMNITLKPYSSIYSDIVNETMPRLDHMDDNIKNALEIYLQKRLDENEC